MGINLAALKTVQKDLVDRTTGNDKLYMQMKEIGEATDFRPLPPLANMNGLYFLEVVVWWINKKRYVSPETFGEPDPIEPILNEAKDADDDDLVELAKNKDTCKKTSEFWVPGLKLTPVLDPDDEETIVDFKVVDDMAKVLSAGTQLLTRMNKIITSRKANEVDSEDGMLDYELGSNLILSKTGEKLNTKYDAELGDEWEVPAKYRDAKNVPDVVKIAKDAIRPNWYLEGVINNYLYGEEMPDDPKKDDKKQEAAKPAAKTAKPKRKEADEDDKPSTLKQTAKSDKNVAAKKPALKRSALSDLD